MNGEPRHTVDETDLARYDRLGQSWWDTDGPMRALHRFNPVRVGWIRDLLAPPSSQNPGAPLEGIRLLDIGCGGGILSESLARLGARMVGIDPAPNNIAVARRHAEAGALTIDYRCTTVEAMDPAERFDAVLAMEVIEHVKEPALFVRQAAALVRPGGLMIGATLNRTAKSYALAIVGGEYILRWLPRGTHDWQKFVTPAEFRALMTRGGLEPSEEAGVTFNPLSGRWGLSRDLACNYMLMARRPGE